MVQRIATGLLLFAFLLTFLLKIGLFVKSISNPLPPFQLDFGAYYIAAAILNSDEPILYDEQIRQETAQNILNISLPFPPYIYPPFLAWLLRPIALLPYAQAIIVWLLLNVLLTVLMVSPLTRMTGLPRKWITFAGIFMLVWLFPLTGLTAFTVGQINLLLLFLFILIVDNANYTSHSRRQIFKDIIIGAAIGVAIGLKLFFAVLIPYFWLYNRRRIAYISIITFLITLVIGAVGAGLGNTSRYFLVIFPSLSESSFRLGWQNYSLAPTIERMFTPVSIPRGAFFLSDPVNIWITPLLDLPKLGVDFGNVAISVFLMLIVLIFALDWTANKQDLFINHDLRLSLLMIAVMLWMPLAWIHSFVMILVPMAIILSPQRRLSIPYRMRVLLVMLACALILVNLYWNYISFALGRPSMPFWVLIVGDLGILIIISIICIELLSQNEWQFRIQKIKSIAHRIAGQIRQPLVK